MQTWEGINFTGTYLLFHWMEFRSTWKENANYRATYLVPYICNSLHLTYPENPQMFNLFLCKNPYLLDVSLASVIKLWQSECYILKFFKVLLTLKYAMFLGFAHLVVLALFYGSFGLPVAQTVAFVET